MVRPSGDQLGISGFAVLRLVSCTAFDPSGSLVQISASPLRYERNASRFPSGENRGAPSALVEMIIRCGAFPGPLGDGSSLRQRSESTTSWTKANRLPCLATAGK